MDLGNLITDTKSMKEGVWVDYRGNARLLIAKMDNPNYRAFIQGQRIAAEEAEEGENPSDALVDIVAKAVANTVLLGWENIEVGKTPLEYSPEEAYKVFKAVPKFLDDVILYASQSKRFADDEFEEALSKIRPS